MSWFVSAMMTILSMKLFNCNSIVRVYSGGISISFRQDIFERVAIVMIEIVSHVYAE